MNFEGFQKPEQNWFKLPNEWTDFTASMKTWAEQKLVEYVLRHTWGFQEYGVPKKITTDEFMNGRKHTDGTRIDKGVGMGKKAVIDGLRQAVDDGFLIEENDLPQQSAPTDSALPSTAEGPPQSSATAPQHTEEAQQASATLEKPITEFPQMKEKTAAHSINVRAVVRIFEDAGVPRSPRTILNLCNPNTDGISRLDCWQDPKDRAYYITQESIERVVAEEKSRGRYGSLQQPIQLGSATEPQSAAATEQPAEEFPPRAEANPDYVPQQPYSDKDGELRALRRKNVEHENTIAAKDKVIDAFQQVWDQMAGRLEKQSELVGSLNQQLLALKDPRENSQPTENREAEEQPSE